VQELAFLQHVQALALARLSVPSTANPRPTAPAPAPSPLPGAVAARAQGHGRRRPPTLAVRRVHLHRVRGTPREALSTYRTGSAGVRRRRGRVRGAPGSPASSRPGVGAGSSPAWWPAVAGGHAPRGIADESRFRPPGSSLAGLRSAADSATSPSNPRAMSPVRYVDSLGALPRGLVAAHRGAGGRGGPRALAVAASTWPCARAATATWSGDAAGAVGRGVGLCLGTDSLASVESLDVLETRGSCTGNSPTWTP